MTFVTFWLVRGFDTQIAARGIYFGGCDRVLNKLRGAEILLNQGVTIGEASKKIGVTEQTYYRWRKEYGGMRVEQARKFKELE